MADITIPPKALEAAYNARRNGDRLEDICIAMLWAWPGMAYRYRISVSLNPQEIILPLPQERE